ncbi:type I restriction enzyme HsdR N-terminal domain-containing protein [Lacibacter sp. MH-610]|uniref:type I restriction enzyme HsdR N-terminal domain-containing protein n=1 Tax=Lacibacter sp. MH-610 TaxID=3020883 RepID=UPI003891C309
MVKVDFPKPDFKIKEEAGKELIFDDIRKQWVRLSPEEWVRQNFIQYLVQTKNYPSALIGVEKEINLGELKKRFDILVYDKNHQPWMMIECKAMEVELTEEVLQQVLRYNISVPVAYLVITNGTYTYCYHCVNEQLYLQEQLPALQ